MGRLGKSLVHTVVAAAEETQQPDVAEDLKLLADFGSKLVIRGIQLGQLVFVRETCR